MGPGSRLPCWGASSFLAVALASLFVARSAVPCGVVGSREARRPSLSYEQVLLVHDPVREQEHFIRSITFRSEDRAFGFIVPTPSRPTAARVSISPFAALRESFHFDAPPPRASSSGTGTGNGFGSGHGRLGGGATVLDVSKVGSFTAFVLAADDDGALRKWLTKNQFVSTPDMDAWLSHYVRLGFFYVALRYEPSNARRTATGSSDRERPFHSETIRISFKTPLPYYPYLEPQPPDPSSGNERLLDLWLVSPSAVVPVSVRENGAERSWVRPMREGQRFDKANEALVSALSPELESLLPPGDLVVQTLQDQKVSRAGFGDVLFVPLDRGGLRPSVDRLEPLLGLIDPELVPAKAATKPR